MCSRRDALGIAGGIGVPSVSVVCWLFEDSMTALSVTSIECRLLRAERRATELVGSLVTDVDVFFRSARRGAKSFGPVKGAKMTCSLRAPLRRGGPRSRCALISRSVSTLPSIASGIVAYRSLLSTDS